MKKGIMAVMSVIFIFGFIGCVSYSHTQSIRNETGATITEVYIRETGATNWGSIKNVQIRRDSYGQAVYNWDGSLVYETKQIGHGTQVVFFEDSSSSETPRGMGNKDIAIRDSNGLLYMKHNVPITFTTTKKNLMAIEGSGISGEALTTSEPITFTAQDRLPMLFVVNQTGYLLTLIAPVERSIKNSERTQFQPMEMNQSIDVIYNIGRARYTEQVTMKNQDATVTLTKRPATLTIVNNVGATINTIFLRIPGTAAWVGGNIVITKDGTVNLSDGGAQAGEISGSIVNKDSMKIWLGNVDLSGNIFDIRIDDVQTRTSYVKSNVQIPNDMTLTFTQADKR